MHKFEGCSRRNPSESSGGDVFGLGMSWRRGRCRHAKEVVKPSVARAGGGISAMITHKSMTFNSKFS